MSSNNGKSITLPVIGLVILCVYLSTFLFESQAPLYFYTVNLTSIKSRIWSDDLGSSEYQDMKEIEYETSTYSDNLYEVTDDIEDTTLNNEIAESIPKKDASNVSVSKNKMPIFLAWTRFHSRHMIHVLKKLHSCPYKCYITSNRSYLPTADFVFHHGADLSTRGLVKTRYPNQKNVFFMRESPGRNNDRFYNGWKKIPMSYFNVTLTYLKRSDYWERYDYFIERTGDAMELVWNEEDVDNAVRAKTNGSLFISSHCAAESGRDGLVRKLSRLTAVTRLGACARKSCDRQCATGMIKSHYFYLALENSICEEYITEKFFKMKQLIVPITFKRKLLQHLAPADSFIAIDDFCSLEELAKYLDYLMKNPKEYKKYFNWTKKYSKSKITGALCELCRDAIIGNVTVTNYALNYTTVSSFMPRSKCQNAMGKKLTRNRCHRENI